MHFAKSSDVFERKFSWQYRVWRAAISHPSVGPIISAVTAQYLPNVPTYGRHCDIDTEGNVVTKVLRDDHWMGPITIGKIDAVRDAVRRLADHCKLSDSERIALFEELRKWVRRDCRALAGQEVRS